MGVLVDGKHDPSDWYQPWCCYDRTGQSLATATIIKPEVWMLKQLYKIIANASGGDVVLFYFHLRLFTSFVGMGDERTL